MEVCQAIYKKLDAHYVEKDLDIIIEAAQNHGVYEHEVRYTSQYVQIERREKKNCFIVILQV